MTEQRVIGTPQELPAHDQPKPPPAPVVGSVSGIVQQLKQERDRAQKEVKTLDAAIAALGSNGSNAQPLQPNPHSLSAALPAQTKPQPAPVAVSQPNQTYNLPQR